jgi:hypothetical protein
MKTSISHNVRFSFLNFHWVDCQLHSEVSSRLSRKFFVETRMQLGNPIREKLDHIDWILMEQRVKFENEN